MRKFMLIMSLITIALLFTVAATASERDYGFYTKHTISSADDYGAQVDTAGKCSACHTDSHTNNSTDIANGYQAIADKHEVGWRIDNQTETVALYQRIDNISGVGGDLNIGFGLSMYA